MNTPVSYVLLNCFGTRKISMFLEVINVFFIRKQLYKIENTTYSVTVEVWLKMFNTTGKY